MGWLAKIFGGDVASVGDLFDKVIGAFKLSPEKKAELEALKEQNATELQKLQIELEGRVQDAISKEVEAASANIRAEAQTGDKYTSRARPSFIYVMLAIFICNFILFPLLKRPALEFPEALFWLFGSCMLGYTGARTWEKFMALPGESSINLPFGIKAGNSGNSQKAGS